MKLRKIAKLIFFALAACIASNAAALAQEVMVVLSSDSPPYQEALAGLQEVYAQPMQVVRLASGEFKPPPRGSIVVAFGGKAALLISSSYEGTLIYSLAPGTKIHSEQHAGISVEIPTSPAVFLVVQKYKALQPSLRRLAVLWVGDSIADYFDQKQAILSSQGVELLSIHLKTLDELPNQLRNLQGKADAIWMPPDASLITPQSFATVREFCLAQHMPFYVPTDGLVEKGATAAAYVSFADLGRLTGEVVKKAENGALGGTSKVFPEKASMAINMTVAKTCRLNVQPELLKQADKVFP